MYGMQLLLCSARSNAPTGDLSAIYTHNSIICGPEAAKQLLAVRRGDDSGPRAMESGLERVEVVPLLCCPQVLLRCAPCLLYGRHVGAVRGPGFDQGGLGFNQCACGATSLRLCDCMRRSTILLKAPCSLSLLFKQLLACSQQAVRSGEQTAVGGRIHGVRGGSSCSHHDDDVVAMGSCSACARRLTSVRSVSHA